MADCLVSAPTTKLGDGLSHTPGASWRFKVWVSLLHHISFNDSAVAQMEDEIPWFTCLGEVLPPAEVLLVWNDITIIWSELWMLAEVYVCIYIILLLPTCHFKPEAAIQIPS